MKFSRILLVISIIFAINACKPDSSNQQTKATSANEVAKADMPIVEKKPDPKCQFLLGFDAWEPYQYADVGGRVAGLDIELINTVVEGMGCQLIFQQGTWVNLLAALKEGEVDMLLGASKTAAREKFALFSEAYRAEEFSLYIRKDDEQRAGYKSLSDFIQNQSKIGIVEDYVYGPEVTMMLDGSETSKYFVNAIMGELNVARLLDADIDGYLEDSFVGASLLRRKALSNYIVAHGLTIQTGDAYVMFSQKSVSTEQLEEFNKQLTKIKNSQTYQDIVDKYSF